MVDTSKFRVPLKTYPAERYYKDLPGLAAQLRADCSCEDDTLDPKIAFETSWEAIKKHQKEYYCADSVQVYPKGKPFMRVYEVRIANSGERRIRTFSCIPPCTRPVCRGCATGDSSIERSLDGLGVLSKGCDYSRWSSLHVIPTVCHIGP